MAKTSAWGKAQRVLRFLFGLSTPQVAAAMVVHGFSEAVLDEGWKLLRDVRPVCLDPDVLPPPVPEPDALEQLLAWERDWMQLARAALKRHFPALHRRLVVPGYPNDRGGKLLAVNDFLRTLDRLEGTAEGKKVRALLESRGLRKSVVDTGRELVGKATRLRKPSTVPDHRSEWQARETALWDWYLEWGSVAWLKIKDRNLLRQLGFLAPARSAHASAEPSDPFGAPEGEEPEPPSPKVARAASKKTRRRRRR